METILIILSWVLWASIWSAILCYVDRFMDGSNRLYGRSRCDHCDHVLGFVDLIPIISYITNKGRCRYCKKSISPRYIIYEIIFGMTRAAIAWFQIYKSDHNSYIYNIIRRLSNLIWIAILTLSDTKYRLIDIRVAILGTITNIWLIVRSNWYHDINISRLYIIWIVLLFVWGGWLIYLLGKLVYRYKYNIAGEWFGEWDIWAMWYISTIMYGILAINHIDISITQIVMYYLIWIIISCILGIFYYLISANKEDKIPFVPCMLLSILIMSIWSDYLYIYYQMYFGL